jgi:RimJ/RimL family protein N-acetyltransferase
MFGSGTSSHFSKPRRNDATIIADMSREGVMVVELRPWSEQDLELLNRLLGDPRMMIHLGGPETPEQITARHGRYLAMQGQDQGEMLVILSDGLAVGSIGYWEREWRGETIWETGWSVLPESQGRGLAKAGLRALLERLRTVNRQIHLHAFPGVENAASNGLCAALGFSLLGEVQFEYPKGHFMSCNDWVFDLESLPQ